MVVHEEAGTEIGPAKLLLRRKQMFVAEVLKTNRRINGDRSNIVESPANIGTQRVSIEALIEPVWLSGPGMATLERRKVAKAVVPSERS